MDYTVHQLAELAGISKRTLRYYEDLGLLSPCRINHNQYRRYTSDDVDCLQQILFYKTLGIPLQKIKALLTAAGYDKKAALETQLAELYDQKVQLDRLIENVRQTIATLKGESKMQDIDKFEGLKQKLLQENEDKYGQEVRQKFGQVAVDASYAKVKGMSQEKYHRMEELTQEFNQTLRAALLEKDPAGELAQKACALHKEWLLLFWPRESYTGKAHRALAQGYLDDARFTAYYEQIAPGSALFLRDALEIYCKN